MLKTDTLAFINNSWVANPQGTVFSVFNPATGDKLADVTSSSIAMTDQAVAAAATAFPAWGALLVAERHKILHALADILTAQTDDLAKLLTAEQGKPLAEARTEITGAIAQLRWNADEAMRHRGDTIPPFKKNTAITVTHEPVGVVAAICPWNFPVGMVLRKIAPALAVGCTVVLKPAPETPLCALAIARAAVEAGLPPGVLNILPASEDDTPPLGNHLVTHKQVAKISFTGSTEVGRLLMEQAGKGLKRISLELGGNAPFLVFASADLEAAAEGLIASKFRNAGQTCICVNRAFVAKDVESDFLRILSAKVARLKMGDGADPQTDIGPLINKDAVTKTNNHIKDALAKGGKNVAGAEDNAAPSGGLFVKPCVISGLTKEMKVFHEETFGPLLAIGTFDREEDAIQLANDTPFGLAAYFYSRDLGQCHRVASALQSGMIGVNEPILSDASIPFGGVKDSGFGREGSHDGLAEFTQTKYVLWGGLGQK